jgi:hypothetical protein
VGVQKQVIAAAVTLLFHPVGHRLAIVHFANLVAHAGIEKDALRRGSLARIDVRNDAEVTCAVEWIFACHRINEEIIMENE